MKVVAQTHTVGAVVAVGIPYFHLALLAKVGPVGILETEVDVRVAGHYNLAGVLAHG